MVSAGLERVPRRRAERRGVEIIVSDTGRGQPVESRRLDRAAEGAGAAKADVVEPEARKFQCKKLRKVDWRALLTVSCIQAVSAKARCLLPDRRLGLSACRHTTIADHHTCEVQGIGKCATSLVFTRR